MIWDVLFWLALVYLVGVSIFVFLWPAFTGRVSKPVDASDNTGSNRRSIWLSVVIAVLVLAGSFYMKYDPDFFRTSWNETEREQAATFGQAIEYYRQASELRTSGRLSADDWQTVLALLEATQDGINRVDNRVLDKIYTDLDETVDSTLRPGLRAGVYGLREYTATTQKPAGNTVNQDMQDSLEIGLELLGAWNEWYAQHKAAVQTGLPTQ